MRRKSPIFESSRKVQRSGSSLAITLPSMFCIINEIKQKQVLNVMYNLDGILIVFDANTEDLVQKLKNFIDKLEAKMDMRTFT